nr:MAG TPA: hypothetical protein [Caudoviricetes sp.]
MDDCRIIVVFKNILSMFIHFLYTYRENLPCQSVPHSL